MTDSVILDLLVPFIMLFIARKLMKQFGMTWPLGPGGVIQEAKRGAAKAKAGTQTAVKAGKALPGQVKGASDSARSLAGKAAAAPERFRDRLENWGREPEKSGFYPAGHAATRDDKDGKSHAEAYAEKHNLDPNDKDAKHYDFKGGDDWRLDFLDPEQRARQAGEDDEDWRLRMNELMRNTGISQADPRTQPPRVEGAPHQRPKAVAPTSPKKLSKLLSKVAPAQKKSAKGDHTDAIRESEQRMRVAAQRGGKEAAALIAERNGHVADSLGGYAEFTNEKAQQAARVEMAENLDVPVGAVPLNPLGGGVVLNKKIDPVDYDLSTQAGRAKLVEEIRKGDILQMLPPSMTKRQAGESEQKYHDRMALLADFSGGRDNDGRMRTGAAALGADQATFDEALRDIEQTGDTGKFDRLTGSALNERLSRAHRMAAKVAHEAHHVPPPTGSSGAQSPPSSPNDRYIKSESGLFVPKG